MKFRTFSILTLLVLLLVSVTPLTAQDETPEPTPEATEEASSEIYTDEASLVVLEETEDTRVIQHLYGETEIPADPQRIVTMQDQNGLLLILELGEGDRVVGSTGATRADGTTFFRRTQDYDTSQVTHLGTFSEPNLELMLELEPDLIITHVFETDEDEYELLSEIAPTVIVEQFTRTVWGSFFDFALLVNAQDEAVALKAAYDERVANLQDALDDPGEISFSLIGPGDGTFWLEAEFYSPEVTIGLEVGLSLTPLKHEVIESGEFTVFSIEEIQRTDADVLYIYDLAAVDSLLDSPLYNTLEVVQAGQAHVVETQRVAGLSVQAMNAWLDVFEETLLVDDLNRDIVQEEE